MNSLELKKRIEFCKAQMDAVSETILDGFLNSQILSEKKQDGSWVTEIDRRVEEILRREIMAAFPGEKIIGEEFGESSGTGDLCWYIDPIDGTQSFVSGVPLFGSMIGLAQEGRSVLGYVNFPALNESIYATSGMGTHWRSQRSDEFVRAQVSETSELKNALFSTTSREYFDSDFTKKSYDLLFESCAVRRGWGDCYGHMLVATGRIDIMLDGGCYDWDSVPFQVICEEAGGRFSSLEGEETALGKSMVSTNGNLFQEVRRLLARSV